MTTDAMYDVVKKLEVWSLKLCIGCYGHMEEAIDENKIDRKDRMQHFHFQNINNCDLWLVDNAAPSVSEPSILL